MKSPSKIASRVDVVAVGLNATDTIVRLPHFPAFDSKVEFLSAGVHLGGQAATATIACSEWGLRTRYIGKVGDDPAAALHERDLSRHHVEAHLLHVPNCRSQSSYILVDESSGERTILWNRDRRLALRPKDLRRGWITSSRALLVDGHDTAAATQAARWAREAQIPVVADLDNLYSGVEALLEVTDYLVSSREFPQRLTGAKDLLHSLPAIQKRFSCRLVAATLGRDGVLAFADTQFIYCRAFRVRVEDTTGAGDIFHAGFVYALLKEWPLRRILNFSCAAAALNCTAPGARGGLAPLAKIERLMKDGRRHRAAYSRVELQSAAARTWKRDR
jgi:sulfofructose kinase